MLRKQTLEEIRSHEMYRIENLASKTGSRKNRKDILVYHTANFVHGLRSNAVKFCNFTTRVCGELYGPYTDLNLSPPACQSLLLPLRHFLLTFLF